MGAASGLRGSFQLDEKTLDQEVTKIKPGVYTLGYKKENTYYVKRVGRSDNDVKAQLKQYIGQYDRFKYEYSKSPKAAFVKECELYHAFRGPEGKLDNKNHPESSSGLESSCLTCKVGKSQETRHPLRVLSPALVIPLIIVTVTSISLASLAYPSTVITVSRTEPTVIIETSTRLETTSRTYLGTSTRSSTYSSTVYTEILICYYPCPEIVYWTSAISFATSSFTSTTQWVSVRELTNTLHRTASTSHTIRVPLTVPAYVAFGMSNMQFAAIAIVIIIAVALTLYWWKIRSLVKGTH